MFAVTSGVANGDGQRREIVRIAGSRPLCYFLPSVGSFSSPKSRLRKFRGRSPFLGWVLIQVMICGCGGSVPETITLGDDGRYHIHPGDNIQAVLDAAAADPLNKQVIIHSGTYRPQYPAQAMVRFHRRHDGIVLSGRGEVILTAENEELANRDLDSFPAIVNHVVYFGDGLSERTVLEGVRITGARGFTTDSEPDGPIEPASDDPRLRKGLFFYLDGGGIKIFGRSYPTVRRVQVVGNQTRLCGGGISIEHRGFNDRSVRIVDSVFLENACPATGPAIDLLEGSSVVIENCLFVGNIGNTGMKEVAAQFGLVYNPKHGSGALTVFPGSRAEVRRCTFTRNWNGVDDRGQGNRYRQCIFYMNDAGDGSLPGLPYELDIMDGSGVTDCWVQGTIDDLQGTVDPLRNSLDAPDPQFDSRFRPGNPLYRGIGYRRTDDPLP